MTLSYVKSTVKQLPYFIGGSIIFAVANFLLISGAHAVDIDEEVEKVDAITTAIGTIIGAMTTLAVVPAGLSAAIRSFRHIVLANV